MPKLVSNHWRISLLSLREDSSCHLGIYNPLWGNETQALEKGIITVESHLGHKTSQRTCHRVGKPTIGQFLVKDPDSRLGLGGHV